MDELATCQINSETYAALEGMLWLEERLNAAILDLRVVSEKQSADQPTKMQNAIGQLTPLGLSNAQAIYHLLKLGYIPSARALIRPMFEYAGITNLIF